MAWSGEASPAPVVSIASIRGRATGAGSKVASDMRFASREKAIFRNGSWRRSRSRRRPDGATAAPHQPRRALEVLLGANDIRGDIAEFYRKRKAGFPHAELDAFVDALATRIATFDKEAIAETKRLVNVASLPPVAEIASEWDRFIASLGRSAAQTRIEALMQRGFHKAGDVENRLGYYVGKLGA
jgi:hypothetical protein